MRTFLLALVLMLSACNARADNLTPRAFADAFAAAAQAAMPSAKVVVKGDFEIETSGVGGGAITSDLHNAYERYREDPQHLTEVIRRYVSVLVETATPPNSSAGVDRSRIVPVLKNIKWLETVLDAAKQQPPDKAMKPLIAPFSKELVVVYAEDRVHSMRFLTTRDDVGDRAGLYQLALSNLHHLLSKIEMRPAADGLWLISAGGDYEASLLLADSVWSSGQIDVDGDIVAAVPTKDALIVTGSKNQAGLARLRIVASELATGPYGLTPTLFVYRGGKFREFDSR